MTEQAPCPECGKPLPEGSAHNLCPACLMGQVMASRTFSTAAGNETTAPPPTLEEIADKFPHFEVVECLGRGGMGVVYKARQKSLDRWVAIKLLAPERVHEEHFADHFEREAKTLAKMSHPNIVTVFDHGQTDGLFYIVMEYIDGLNLRDLLREAKMEPEQALAIIPPICDALEYAHDKGVVHRDIKPENILLDREGRVKIADFGIASLVGASGEKSGTPPYMAPEQENGIVDRRADIYALGVVLYEMLTGERPDKDFKAPSKKVRIDIRLDEIVLRALEITPALRYQTAGEFRTQVDTVISNPGKVSWREPERSATKELQTLESRFSRTAILGACWAPIFFVVFLLYFTDSQLSDGSRHIPGVWQTLMSIMVSVLGISAPLGTTILGWIAVSQIRRSVAKIHGLWLAVFDGLLFPLLSMTALVGWFWHWVIYDLIRASIVDGAPELSSLQRLIVTNTSALTALATMATSLVLGIFIIRRVWRAVIHRGASDPLSLPIGKIQESPGSKSRKVRIIAATAITVAALATGAGVIMPMKFAADARQRNAQFMKEAEEHTRAHEAMQADLTALTQAVHSINEFALIATLPELDQTTSLTAAGETLRRVWKVHDPLGPESQEFRRYLVNGVGQWSRSLDNPDKVYRSLPDSIRNALNSVKHSKSEYLPHDGDIRGHLERYLKCIELGENEIAKKLSNADGNADSIKFGSVVERVRPFNEDNLTDSIEIEADPICSRNAENVNPTVPLPPPSLAIRLDPPYNRPYVEVSLGTFIQPLRTEQWDSMTAVEAASLMRDAVVSLRGTLSVSGEGPLPRPYIFKTKTGGVGLLQITGFTENPRGVKIRYKLVNSAGKSTKSGGFKPIPPQAARLLEEIRQVHDSPEFRSLSSDKPDEIKHYNEEINRRLKMLQELLRGTQAESLFDESMLLNQRIREQAREKHMVDPELRERADALSKQLQEMLKSAAPTPGEEQARKTVDVVYVVPDGYRGPVYVDQKPSALPEVEDRQKNTLIVTTVNEHGEGVQVGAIELVSGWTYVESVRQRDGLRIKTADDHPMDDEVAWRQIGGFGPSKQAHRPIAFGAYYIGTKAQADKFRVELERLLNAPETDASALPPSSLSEAQKLNDSQPKPMNDADYQALTQRILVKIAAIKHQYPLLETMKNPTMGARGVGSLWFEHGIRWELFRRPDQSDLDSSRLMGKKAVHDPNSLWFEIYFKRDARRHRVDPALVKFGEPELWFSYAWGYRVGDAEPVSGEGTKVTLPAEGIPPDDVRNILIAIGQIIEEQKKIFDAKSKDAPDAAEAKHGEVELYCENLRNDGSMENAVSLTGTQFPKTGKFGLAGEVELSWRFAGHRDGADTYEISIAYAANPKVKLPAIKWVDPANAPGMGKPALSQVAYTGKPQLVFEDGMHRITLRASTLGDREQSVGTYTGNTSMVPGDLNLPVAKEDEGIRLYTDEEAEAFRAKLDTLKYPITTQAACEALGIDLKRLTGKDGLMKSSIDGRVGQNFARVSPNYSISFQFQVYIHGPDGKPVENDKGEIDKVSIYHRVETREIRKKDDRVGLSIHDDTLFVDVMSPSGIGDARLALTSGVWPKKVVVRLKYAADRPFTRLEGPGVTLEEKEEQDEYLKVELSPKKDGYEASIPPTKRKTLYLHWVDAYRN